VEFVKLNLGFSDKKPTLRYLSYAYSISVLSYLFKNFFEKKKRINFEYCFFYAFKIFTLFPLSYLCLLFLLFVVSLLHYALHLI